MKYLGAALVLFPVLITILLYITPLWAIVFLVYLGPITIILSYVVFPIIGVFLLFKHQKDQKKLKFSKTFLIIVALIVIVFFYKYGSSLLRM